MYTVYVYSMHTSPYIKYTYIKSSIMIFLNYKIILNVVSCVYCEDRMADVKCVTPVICVFFSLIF